MAKRGRPRKYLNKSSYKDVSIRLKKQSINILKTIQTSKNHTYFHETVNHVIEQIKLTNQPVKENGYVQQMRLGLEVNHLSDIIQFVQKTLQFQYQEIGDDILIKRNDSLYLVALFGTPMETIEGDSAYPFCYLHFDDFNAPTDFDAVEDWNDDHPSDNIFINKNNKYVYYKVFSFFGNYPTDQLTDELDHFFEISDKLIAKFGRAINN